MLRKLLSLFSSKRSFFQLFFIRNPSSYVQLSVDGEFFRSQMDLRFYSQIQKEKLSMKNLQGKYFLSRIFSVIRTQSKSGCTLQREEVELYQMAGMALFSNKSYVNPPPKAWQRQPPSYNRRKLPQNNLSIHLIYILLLKKLFFSQTAQKENCRL